MLENKTGRILAMAGGFSYPLSQLNRVTQSQRQPGSTLKPLTYLAALSQGLQPNTLVLRRADHPAADRRRAIARAQDYWTPKNYDGGVRRHHDPAPRPRNSKNLVTARLLEGGIADDARRAWTASATSPSRRRSTRECERYYPFVLGAQPVRMIDLAAFYAAVANEGARPSPYALECVEQDGSAVYRARRDAAADRLGRPASPSTSSRPCCRA